MGCPVCGAELAWADTSMFVTAVAYMSPPGHTHDDNCQTRGYSCVNDHRFVLSKRNRCITVNPDGTTCTWVGKDSCFCHPGKKVDEWPVSQWPVS